MGGTGSGAHPEEDALIAPHSAGVRSALLSLLLIAAWPTAGRAADPVRLGPFTSVNTVAGISVAMPIRYEAWQDGELIRVRAIADLSDLAAKIGEIIDTIELPRDNCASYSPQNMVAAIRSKSLGYAGDGAARLDIHGDVVLWECLENPIRKTAVQWQLRAVGWGLMRTHIPVVVDLGPGDPLRTILFTQPFGLSLPVTLAKSGDRSVAIQLSRPDITLKGRLAFITRGVLQIAGVTLNDKLEEALRAGIRPEALTLSIPSLTGFDPVVDSVRFIDDGGHLAAELIVGARVNPAELFKVFQGLVDLLRKAA